MSTVQISIVAASGEEMRTELLKLLGNIDMRATASGPSVTPVANNIPEPAHEPVVTPTPSAVTPEQEPPNTVPFEPAEKPKGKRGRPAASEAPKAEAPKAEAPKAEAPKAEAPKAEAPKAEAPKAEAPKAEAPKAEAPKAEAPKAEAPKAEAPKAEAQEMSDKQYDILKADAVTLAMLLRETKTGEPLKTAQKHGVKIGMTPKDKVNAVLDDLVAATNALTEAAWAKLKESDEANETGFVAGLDKLSDATQERIDYLRSV